MGKRNQHCEWVEGGNRAENGDNREGAARCRMLCGVVYFASGMERKRVGRKSFLFLGEILTQSHKCERHQRLFEGGEGGRGRERETKRIME